MARKRRLLILTLCLATLAASLAYAQGGYDLSWWTADGGGGTSSGGDYALTGTAGQGEVGALMQGGTYGLAGGFWGGAGAAHYALYLPVVMKLSP